MIVITDSGTIITDPAAFKAYLESLRPRRFGRLKKKVAAKKRWQTALKQVAAATEQTEGK